MFRVPVKAMGGHEPSPSLYYSGHGKSV
jgi:hypothetical protein